MSARSGMTMWVCLFLVVTVAQASYVNFEVSHVNPIALTPSGDRLLAINTPDALLEVFSVQPDGSLLPEASIPVGLEPVTVAVRNEGEAWVVNNLSDSVSVVDLDDGVTVRTLPVGDEPTDVAFASGKAFVSVSSLDHVKVFDLADLTAAPVEVPLFGRDVRAVAASGDGTKVYAVVLKSGNRTTIAGVHQTFPSASGLNLDPSRLLALDLRDLDCDGPEPSYPPLPAGVVRDGSLVDPPDGVPRVGLIVKWDEAAGEWQDELGQDWSHCLPYTLPDSDLFIIDATTLAVTEVSGLGTTLFDVSPHPNGKVYVPNTDARNEVRFEHAAGVQGHMVDNLLSVVDPASGNAITRIELNSHINRSSDPATNLAERLASISQPGMLVWNGTGSSGYLTAIGSRKLFRVSGSCLTGSCIFGASRATPDTVEVGEGPTGVALREIGAAADHRLYVLNRISHSIAVVRVDSLAKLDEVPLHDPSSEATLEGRRFLYDAIDTSAHGDSACSSCHISGDMDGLAWDLGNPEGEFQSYSDPMDNVRFVVPFGNVPFECSPAVCAAHDGFDPQKGPMTTQSLRGMLEPLHWRGDRPTMNDFNKAFVGLMGTEDIGPINGAPAGLSEAEMEAFRQFALEINYPPNPFRNVDDSTPCGPRSTDPNCEVLVHGALFAGNPTEGARIFDFEPTDANQPCVACHTHPFGAGGGQLGGVQPANPTSGNAAALFNGDADGSPHSDLKIPHLRNMYEKFGPVLAEPGDNSMPPTTTGFGFTHDGGIPDMYRFFSANVFTLSFAGQAQEVRDIVAFMFFFPTGIKPGAGAQVTLPAGTPPTGPAADEALLSTLIGLGDLADGNRDCELTASAVSGNRLRSYHLVGGSWVTDEAGEPAITLSALREVASSPVTFTCVTLGSGPRLGGDRDEDLVLNGDDCAPGDGETFGPAAAVTDLVLERQLVDPELQWSGQSPVTGPSVRYDVLGGDLSVLRAGGVGTLGCVAPGLIDADHLDGLGTPAVGDGHAYLVRATNPCGSGDLGPGREALETFACP